MSVFRQFCASFLLLCFVRVLLPEAWILALHPHQHTTEEPAQRPTNKSRALLTTRHQHCSTDSFYHAAFQPPTPVLLPARLGAAYVVVAARSVAPLCGTVLRPRFARGPPQGLPS